MSPHLVVVSDSVFPNLDPAREVLSAIGAELQMAGEPTPEVIAKAAAAADALLVTYAKITAEMIQQMARCRIIARFGIGVDNVDIPAATDRGIRVVAFDPYVPSEVFTQAGVERVDFAQLLRLSDYVSIHSPLLPETRNLFNAEAFRQMKPTAYLVNTARGPIVDAAALAEALDAGHLAGAPLVGRDRVILTPHTSFYSEESLVELQVKAAEEVVRVLSGQAPRNPVNPEAVQRTA